MATLQWREIPWLLTSPRGTVAFNEFLTGVSGPQWILDPDGCRMGAGMRVTRDNVPQGDGEIEHKKYRTGYVVALQMLAATATFAGMSSGSAAEACEFTPTCDEDLVDLFDNLMLNLDGMQNEDGRIQWTPTAKTDRMVNSARWLGPTGDGGTGFQSVDAERDSEIYSMVSFAVLSPFPYAMDAPDTTTTLDDSTPVTITNGGTTSYYPVFRIDGPTSAFVIHNNTTDLLVSYDSSFPGADPIGGGDYLEFDFFRNTAYLNGDGANEKSGIDVTTSDFFTLVPGANEIEVDGAGGTMIWQNAYV